MFSFHLTCLALLLTLLPGGFSSAVFAAGGLPEPRMEIIVSVVDDDTSLPIKEFEVTGSSGLQITLDPKKPGTFKARLARNNYPYLFRVEARGYAPFKTERFITPAEGTSLHKTFRLGKGGTVIGRVVRADDGSPIPDVQIESIDSQLEDGLWREYPTCVTGSTDSEGHFRFEGVGAGEQEFNLTPPTTSGLVAGNFRTIVVNGDVTNMEDIRLGAGSSIEGRLVFTPGDRPIAGQRITIGKREETTDSDGHFRFSGLRNGLYEIAIEELEFKTCVAVESLENKSITVKISANPLTIRFLKDGKPVKSLGRLLRAGANQSIIKFWHSDDGGILKLNNLSPGPWQLEGFPVDDSVTSTHLHHVVEMPEDGAEVDLTLSYPSARVAVTVTKPDGSPMPGATVRLRTPTTTSTQPADREINRLADEKGVADFQDLVAQKYVVYAFASDSLRSEPAEVLASETEPSDVRLLLNPARGGALESTTLHIESGKPVTKSWCYLFRPDGSLWEHAATRGDNGVLKIDGIPPGKYDAQVSGFGFSVAVHSVEIREGKTVSLSDVLYPAGALRWKLLDSQGKPVPGAPCSLTPLTKETLEVVRHGVTDREGIYVVRGIYPGDYLVSGTDLTGKRQASQKLSISPANLTQETVTLK